MTWLVPFVIAFVLSRLAIMDSKVVNAAQGAALRSLGRGIGTMPANG
jgi:hypothetical protein